MKKNFLRIVGIAVVGTMGVSCTTSYDSYGNRRQSVSPGGVAVGAIALGALAYSIGKDDGKRKEHRRHSNHKNQFKHYGHQNSGYQGYRSHGTGYGHGHSRGYSGGRYYR